LSLSTLHVQHKSVFSGERVLEFAMGGTHRQL